jgi:hypothetical protein
MPGPIDQAALIRYIADALDGVDVVEMSGNRFFFYDPGHDRPVDRRFPFATLVTSDEYDQASSLSRDGVYRLNVGVSRETCRALFGPAAQVDAAEPACDFTALDTIMPHPVYGSMHWVCVLNPSAETFERVKPLLVEAHERAAGRYTRSHQPGSVQERGSQDDGQQEETW